MNKGFQKITVRSGSNQVNHFGKDLSGSSSEDESECSDYHKNHCVEEDIIQPHCETGLSGDRTFEEVYGHDHSNKNNNKKSSAKFRKGQPINFQGSYQNDEARHSDHPQYTVGKPINFKVGMQDETVLSDDSSVCELHGRNRYDSNMHDHSSEDDSDNENGQRRNRSSQKQQYQVGQPIQLSIDTHQDYSHDQCNHSNHDHHCEHYEHQCEDCDHQDYSSHHHHHSKQGHHHQPDHSTHGGNHHHNKQQNHDNHHKKHQNHDHHHNKQQNHDHSTHGQYHIGDTVNVHIDIEDDTSDQRTMKQLPQIYVDQYNSETTLNCKEEEEGEEEEFEIVIKKATKIEASNKKHLKKLKQINKNQRVTSSEDNLSEQSIGASSIHQKDVYLQQPDSQLRQSTKNITLTKSRKGSSHSSGSEMNDSHHCDHNHPHSQQHLTRVVSSRSSLRKHSSIKNHLPIDIDVTPDVSNNNEYTVVVSHSLEEDEIEASINHQEVSSKSKNEALAAVDVFQKSRRMSFAAPGTLATAHADVRTPKSHRRTRSQPKNQIDKIDAVDIFQTSRKMSRVNHTNVASAHADVKTRKISPKDEIRDISDESISYEGNWQEKLMRQQQVEEREKQRIEQEKQQRVEYERRQRQEQEQAKYEKFERMKREEYTRIEKEKQQKLIEERQFRLDNFQNEIVIKKQKDLKKIAIQAMQQRKELKEFEHMEKTVNNQEYKSVQRSSTTKKSSRYTHQSVINEEFNQRTVEKKQIDQKTEDQKRMEVARVDHTEKIRRKSEQVQRQNFINEERARSSSDMSHDFVAIDIPGRPRQLKIANKFKGPPMETASATNTPMLSNNRKMSEASIAAKSNPVITRNNTQVRRTSNEDLMRENSLNIPSKPKRKASNPNAILGRSEIEQEKSKSVEALPLPRAQTLPRGFGKKTFDGKQAWTKLHTLMKDSAMTKQRSMTTTEAHSNETQQREQHLNVQHNKQRSKSFSFQHNQSTNRKHSAYQQQTQSNNMQTFLASQRQMQHSTSNEQSQKIQSSFEKQQFEKSSMGKQSRSKSMMSHNESATSNYNLKLSQQHNEQRLQQQQQSLRQLSDYRKQSKINYEDAHINNVESIRVEAKGGVISLIMEEGDDVKSSISDSVKTNLTNQVFKQNKNKHFLESNSHKSNPVKMNRSLTLDHAKRDQGDKYTFHEKKRSKSFRHQRNKHNDEYNEKYYRSNVNIRDQNRDQRSLKRVASYDDIKNKTTLEQFRDGDRRIPGEYVYYTVCTRYFEPEENDWIQNIHRNGRVKVPRDLEHEEKCVFWHDLYEPDKEEILVRKLIPQLNKKQQKKDDAFHSEGEDKHSDNDPVLYGSHPQMFNPRLQQIKKNNYNFDSNGSSDGFDHVSVLSDISFDIGRARNVQRIR